MRNNNVSSIPNDTVVILATIVRDADGNLVINPQEIAFGKFDEQSTSFYCIDNSEYYESLSDNLYDLEEGKLYYCFDKTIDELRNVYGEDLTNNALMYNYMCDILDTFNIALKEDNKYTIHSIPLSVLKNKGNDPINEMNSSNNDDDKVKEKPKEIVKPTIIINDKKSNNNHVDLLEFEKYLKDRVIGNDRVLENIASTMLLNLTAPNPKLVDNVLNIGPTGTGKTYTFELISEYLGVPIVIYNTSSLSTAGYQGNDTNDLLKQVYDSADGKIEVANKAIIILDEIDKLKNTKLDIKEQAQNDLLALLGGSEIEVELNPHTGATCKLNTKSMTFVGNGAFTEIFDGKTKFAHNPIGYFTPEQRAEMDKKKEEKKFKTEVTDEDLIKYGLKRELIGRFAKRNVFTNLDAKGLAKVLTDAKESVLNLKKQRYLEQFNTELKCDSSFIDAVVELALKEKLGGRSLNKVCANIFERVDRQMLIEDHTDHKVLKLTRKNVENPDKFTFRKKKI